MVVVAAVIVVQYQVWAHWVVIAAIQRERFRESDLNETLELEINDIPYADPMIMHNPQVTSIPKD